MQKLKYLSLSLYGLVITLILILPLLTWQPSSAQTADPTSPAPTLVPPTLVPTPTLAANQPQATRELISGIATMQTEQVMRVGTLYNVYPFAWLTETGTIEGYEAEVIRALAVDLEVEVDFVQVTAETQWQMLLNGEVDMLIGEQMPTKQAEEFVEFSYTYYYNQQRMVIRQGEPYTTLADLANRRIAVEAGSRGESALNLWMAQNGIGFQAVRYLSMDEALDALANGEVDGMVGELDDLARAGRQQMSLIPEAINLDAYAIVFRRHDVNLRNAINRSLQRLYASGRLNEIAKKWFPTEDINFAAFIPKYLNMYDDTRTVADFPTDMPLPAQSVLDKIKARGTLIVAGLSLSENDPSYARYLDPLNQAIILEMAARWGVQVQFMSGTYNLGADMVSQGSADMAIGVRPRWDGADRVDYSIPYHHRQDVIIGLVGSRYAALRDFRGGSVIGYYQDDPDDALRLETLREALNLNYSLYTFPNNVAAKEALFDTRNVDGLFGDNIRLQAFMSQYDFIDWRTIFTDDNFEPIVIAVPRNDADFLTLVNWTLSDMRWDGTLERLWEAHYGWDAPPWMPRYIGVGDFLLP